MDDAHMKHRRYNGIKIILVGRDGNVPNQVASVALVPLEDFVNYACSFGCVIYHGFPLKSSPVSVIVRLVSYRRRLFSISSTCILSVTLSVRAILFCFVTNSTLSNIEQTRPYGSLSVPTHSCGLPMQLRLKMYSTTQSRSSDSSAQALRHFSVLFLLRSGPYIPP